MDGTQGSRIPAVKRQYPYVADTVLKKSSDLSTARRNKRCNLVSASRPNYLQKLKRNWAQSTASYPRTDARSTRRLVYVIDCSPALSATLQVERRPIKSPTPVGTPALSTTSPPPASGRVYRTSPEHLPPRPGVVNYASTYRIGLSAPIDIQNIGNQ